MSLEKIGKYIIKGELGKGSMGVVYKALDPSIGRYVAIKTIGQVDNKKFNTKAEALERFKIEAQSAGRLRHPSIITIFDANIEADFAYIVMDYVEGKSLDQVLKESGKLHPHTSLYYLKQLCSALDEAMENGVLHRDIKPANVMVDGYHNVFLLDFGVAALSEQLKNQQPGGPIVGTPAYMSPEQVKKEVLDHRSDLFSLAILAFQLLSGQRPFTGKDYKEVLANIVYADPIEITTLADMPSALTEVFKIALAKDPKNRYPNAKTFFKAMLKAFGLKRIEAPRDLAQADWKKYVEEPDEDAKPAPLKAFNASGIKLKAANKTKHKKNSYIDDDNSGLKKLIIILIAACVLVAIVFIFMNIKKNIPVDNKPISRLESSENQITVKLGEQASEKLVVEDEKTLIEKMRQAFTKRSENKFELISAELNNDSYVVRAEAIKLLSQISDERVEGEILALITDHDPLIRSLVAQAMQKVGTAKSLGYLESRMREEENAKVAYEIELAINAIQKK